MGKGERLFLFLLKTNCHIFFTLFSKMDGTIEESSRKDKKFRSKNYGQISLTKQGSELWKDCAIFSEGPRTGRLR